MAHDGMTIAAASQRQVGSARGADHRHPFESRTLATRQLLPQRRSVYSPALRALRLGGIQLPSALLADAG